MATPADDGGKESATTTAKEGGKEGGGGGGGGGGGSKAWSSLHLAAHLLQLLLDLLPRCPPPVLRRALEGLAERLGAAAEAPSSAEFCRVWRGVFTPLPTVLWLSLLPAVAGAPAADAAAATGEGSGSERSSGDSGGGGMRGDELIGLVLGSRGGLLGLAASSLSADDVELLLDFVSLSDDDLRAAAAAAERGAPPASAAAVTAVGDGAAGGGALARAQEHAALAVCELCEAAARGARPNAAHDHLKASGAPAVLAVLGMLGHATEAVRVCARARSPHSSAPRLMRRRRAAG